MILPIYAGLERIPGSLLEASADLGGARRDRRSGGSILPLVFPAVVAGSIFTFSLTLGDYITPTWSRRREVHRQRDLRQLEPRQPAARGGLLVRADRDHDRVPRSSPAGSARSSRCERQRMTESRWVRIALRVADRPDAGLPLPAARGRSRSTPSTPAAPGLAARRLLAALVRRGGRQPGASRRRSALDRWPRPAPPPSPWCSDARRAGRRSATGSSGARRSRSCWCCRSPCPAWSRASRWPPTFKTIGVDFGLLTIIVGHATFCVVIAYNNVIARLRRLPRSPEEASADLGADTWHDLPPRHAAAARDGAAVRRRCSRSPSRSTRSS